MNYNQNPLQIAGDRNPRPTKERVVSDSEEQGGSPPGPEVQAGVVESHVQALGEGPPPHGVLLLHLPQRLPLPRRRRLLLRRVSTAAAGEDEDQKRDDEGVDEQQRRPQRLEDGDYAVAGAGGQRLHLGHGGGERKRRAKQHGNRQNTRGLIRWMRSWRRRRGIYADVVRGIYSEVVMGS